MVKGALHLRRKKQSPWSSASEKGIDSLADWLIPTLGRPDGFALHIKNIIRRIEKRKKESRGKIERGVSMLKR